MNKIVQDFENEASPEKAKIAQRFFKTGPGQYGEGDQFLGITNPIARKYAKLLRPSPQSLVLKLLRSPHHEKRLLALLIWVLQYQKGDGAKPVKSPNPALRANIYHSYLSNYQHINNWDLVDLSAEHIVGAHLAQEAARQTPTTLLTLAQCDNLWKNRIAIIATFHSIKQKNPQPTLQIAKILLYHQHDLIHKAVGWALREVGKKCGKKHLLDFLDQYAETMPRTCLRYSIEKLSSEEKLHYMNRKNEKKNLLS